MGVSVYREVTMTTTTTATVGSSTAATATKASTSNVLMCRQWWKVCWMYGDQEKYYRQLYGAAKKSPSSGDGSGGGGSGRAAVMELQQMSSVSFAPPPPPRSAGLPQLHDDRLVSKPRFFVSFLTFFLLRVNNIHTDLRSPTRYYYNGYTRNYRVYTRHLVYQRLDLGSSDLTHARLMRFYLNSHRLSPK